jgi:hypothetical protein
MAQNEARHNDGEHHTLPDAVREVAMKSDGISDDEFRSVLLAAVREKVLKPTWAIYCYCRRHNIPDFTICNLQLPEAPRPPVLDFLDDLLQFDGFPYFLEVADRERLAGRL